MDFGTRVTYRSDREWGYHGGDGDDAAFGGSDSGN